jgi:transcriptional regulator with PAS, ATPase and Fis domain
LQAKVRVIAATNRTLANNVENGRFRAHLFYRLNVFHIGLPPLRERRSDISLLCEYFLGRCAARNQATHSILDGAAKVSLESYDYFGNVRELEQIINKLAVQAGGRVITGPDVNAVLRLAKAHPESDLQQWENLPFHEAVAKWERYLIERAQSLSEGNKSDVRGVSLSNAACFTKRCNSCFPANDSTVSMLSL